MFDKDQDRYITRGIESELPKSLVIILWELIEEAKKDTKLDYLQVFELERVENKENKVIQKVTHRQEVPEYRKVIHLEIKDPVDEKVFAIDDKSHSTMLLASEY